MQEPIEDGLVRHDLRATELDDVAEQLGTGDRLHDASRRVLAQDGLHLRLAASRDDGERSNDGPLEIVEDSAFFGEHERETEDRAGDTRPGQLLLAHPARGVVLVVGVELGADRADENHRAHAGGLGRPAKDPRPIHVDREVGLRPVAPDGDEADDVLGALGRLSHGRGVERVAHDHLGASNFERGRGHRITHEHAKLVPAVEDLVRHAAADEACRAEQKDSCHGSES